MPAAGSGQGAAGRAAKQAAGIGKALTPYAEAEGKALSGEILRKGAEIRRKEPRALEEGLL